MHTLESASKSKFSIPGLASVSEADCSRLDPDLLAAFAAGTLDPAERNAVDAHLDTCGACRFVAYALLSESDESFQDKPSSPGAEPPSGETECDGGMVPGTQLAHYRVERALGAGAMGVVHLATDVRLGRRVALKSLRGVGSLLPTEVGTRLLAEARAMARVAHPGVTVLYDVVEAQGRTVLAMEYVEGTTLARWLAEPGRSWHEVVDIFVQAASALAAAHAVGVVHHDFKPTNVLVGSNGRARVTDFGLARLGAGVAAAPCGTLRYMSPEARRGRADARSDQYAFGVAMHEALAHVASGSRPAPRAARVRLRNVLERALDPDPASRWPSMADLAAELTQTLRPSPQPRSLALFAVGAGLLLVAALRVGAERSALEACVDAPVDVWDAEARQKAHDAFVVTGQARADDAWKRVDHAMQAFRTEYVAERHVVCEARFGPDGRGEAEVDARLACLADRRRDASALASALAHVDASTLDAAVTASPLVAPSVCEEADAPQRRVLRPADPFTAASVSLARDELAEIRALLATGQVKRAHVRARSALTRAEATAFAPVVAEATRLLGVAQIGSEASAVAPSTLERAARLADEVGDDALRAESWIDTLRADYELWRTDRVPLLRDEGLTALARAHAPALVRAELHQLLGSILVEQRDLDGGEAELRQALALRETAGPKGRTAATRTRSSLAIVVALRGDTASAAAWFRGALGVFAEELGPAHPRVAGTHLALGQTLLEDGRPAEALPEIASALRGAESALGPHASLVGSAETALALAWLELEVPGNALEHAERSLAVWEGIRDDHPGRVMALVAAGRAELALGNAGGALRRLERADALPSPTDPNDLAELRFALALAADAVNQGTRAERLAKEAADLYAAAARAPRRLRDHARVRTWLASKEVRP